MKGKRAVSGVWAAAFALAAGIFTSSVSGLAAAAQESAESTQNAGSFENSTSLPVLVRERSYTGTQGEDAPSLVYFYYDQIHPCTVRFEEILGGTPGAAASGPEMSDGMSEAITKLNQEVSAFALSTEAEYENIAQSDYETYSGDWDYNRYALNIDLMVQRLDEHVYSVLMQEYSYTNGAHGSTIFTGYNYNTADGTKLALQDVFPDTSVLAEKIANRMRELYPELTDDLFSVSVEQLIQGMIDETGYSGSLAFTLAPDCVNFWFGPGSVAAYAAGGQAVSFTYEELSGIIKEAFVPAGSGDFIRQIPNFLAVNVPSGSGFAKLSLEGIENQQDGYSTGEMSMHLTYGTTSMEERRYAYAYSGYYAQKDGVRYLIVNYLQDNDWQSTDIYRLGDDGIAKTTDSADGIYDFIPLDPSRFALKSRIYICGTTLRANLYSIREDGSINPFYPWYADINTLAETGVTAKTDIQAQIVTDQAAPEKASLAEAVIPAGTVMNYYRTDNDRCMDFITQDGTIYRITMDHGDGLDMINGQQVTDLLDGVVYAG